MKHSKTASSLFLIVLNSFLAPSLASDAAGNLSAAEPTPREAATDTKVSPLMLKELTGLPGKEAEMLIVEYAPGAASDKHRHNAYTFVYVLEGHIVMQVQGGKKTTLGPGETFYESPDDIHSVSRNASDSRPARFLVFFVKDKHAPETVPVK